MATQRQKIVFITFALGVYVNIFFETFFMYARPLPVQIKAYFKILQLLAVAHAMGF